MTFDYTGSWSAAVGPNTPLNGTSSIVTTTTALASVPASKVYQTESYSAMTNYLCRSFLDSPTMQGLLNLTVLLLLILLDLLMYQVRVDCFGFV